MQTAIIWNEFEQIKYFVIDGDQSHLNGIYINSCEDPQELQHELSVLMYNQTTWYIKYTDVTLTELADAIRAGAILIECGFMP